MDLKSLALDDLLNDNEAQHNGQDIAIVSEDASAQRCTAVAIIGMSGQIGAANNLDEFWAMLANGESGQRSLPEARKDNFETYLHLRGAFHAVHESDYLNETYLDAIDQFDYRFFGLSKQEANYMDPNQRIFLQNAWAALENAGYSGESIEGSQTGIFCGFSADFGQDYRHITHVFAPDSPEVSVAGNIRSIIASRIAYHLDLHGPSMIIDTACSSGLVCIHQAVRSLRSGECDTALVGTVKLDMLPILDKNNLGVGIKDIQDTIASDGRTKTFDDFADGTSAAEGSIAYLLKPLDKAEQDGDNIHAVIVGSAINQDGLSVGITAPNSAAQEALIVSALEDAQLAPEQINYIEAHGTATKLGDPIEISGIQRAFSRYTQRKQFCAIGSVKSNIGHMDNAAGLAGLAKVVLAMQHQQIPPTLNFNTPNRNIPFEQTPVYVNDHLSPWPAGDSPRYAGINSFGLSGTNCHVLVQAYDKPTTKKASSQPALIALSAMNAEALQQQVQQLHQWLSQQDLQQVDLLNLSFTLLAGRRHMSHRVAIQANNAEQLLAVLEDLTNGNDNQAAQTASFRVVPDEAIQDQDITEAEQATFSEQANQQLQQATGFPLSAEQIATLSQLYLQGANAQWKAEFTRLAQGSEYTLHRLALPSYPFAKERCWVEVTARAELALNQGTNAKAYSHPLLDQCVVDSFGVQIYRTNLSTHQHWELADHIVKGVCVLPGTCYVEMILQIAKQLRGGHSHDHPWPVAIERLQFLAPFAIFPRENRDIHLQVHQKENSDNYRITIVSRDDKGVNAHSQDLQWDIHAEGEIRLSLESERETPTSINLAQIQQRLKKHMLFSRSDDTSRGLDIGDRWNHSFIDGWYNDSLEEFLVQLAIPAPFANEASIYAYHPALLDVAVNSANHMLGDNQLFLPFGYKQFNVSNKLPADCFVYLKALTDTKNNHAEIFKFDVKLVSTTGEIVGHVAEYTIKRVPENEQFIQNNEAPHAFSLRAIPVTTEHEEALDFENANAPIIVIHNEDSEQQQLIAQLQNDHSNVITIEESEAAAQLKQLAQQEKQLLSVVYCATLATQHREVALSATLNTLATSLNALVTNKFTLLGPTLVLTCNGVTAPADNRKDYQILPFQAAITGFVRSTALENPQLGLSCLDISPQQLHPSLGQTNGANNEHCAWLINAINHSQAQGELICLHDSTRYSEQVEVIDLSHDDQLNLASDGVYVITGGTGALGAAVALDLQQQWLQQASADASRLNIALIGHRPLPEMDSWKTLLATSKDSALLERLRPLQQLRDAGVNLRVDIIDVANRSALEHYLNELRSQFSRILGVVHAAGRAGDGFLINKTPEQLQQVVNSKAQSAWWLHELTENDPLQFFVMYSSIATVLRNPGQSDYTAANAFLDALAEYRRNQGLSALSIGWPAWREIGIAVSYNAVDETEFFAPINTTDALSLLRRAINSGNSLPASVVLAELNPQAQQSTLDSLGLSASEGLQHWLNKSEKVEQHKTGDAAGGDVVLKGVDASDDILQQVAQAWHKVLAMPEFDIDESFNALGGNSILTTQLYKEFDQLHPGMIDMADLFSQTTIRQQAAHLRNALGLPDPAQTATNSQNAQNAQNAAPSKDEPSVDDILAKLASGELSAEEAQDLL